MPARVTSSGDALDQEIAALIVDRSAEPHQRAEAALVLLFDADPGVGSEARHHAARSRPSTIEVHARHLEGGRCRPWLCHRERRRLFGGEGAIALELGSACELGCARVVERAEGLGHEPEGGPPPDGAGPLVVLLLVFLFRREVAGVVTGEPAHDRAIGAAIGEPSLDVSGEARGRLTGDAGDAQAAASHVDLDEAKGKNAGRVTGDLRHPALHGHELGRVGIVGLVGPAATLEAERGRELGRVEHEVATELGAGERGHAIGGFGGELPPVGKPSRRGRRLAEERTQGDVAREPLASIPARRLDGLTHCFSDAPGDLDPLPLHHCVRADALQIEVDVTDGAGSQRNGHASSGDAGSNQPILGGVHGSAEHVGRERGVARSERRGVHTEASEHADRLARQRLCPEHRHPRIDREVLFREPVRRLAEASRERRWRGAVVAERFEAAVHRVAPLHRRPRAEPRWLHRRHGRFDRVGDRARHLASAALVEPSLGRGHPVVKRVAIEMAWPRVRVGGGEEEPIDADAAGDGEAPRGELGEKARARVEVERDQRHAFSAPIVDHQRSGEKTTAHPDGGLRTYRPIPRQRCAERRRDVAPGGTCAELARASDG